MIIDADANEDLGSEQMVYSHINNGDDSNTSNYIDVHGNGDQKHQNHGENELLHLPNRVLAEEDGRYCFSITHLNLALNHRGHSWWFSSIPQWQTEKLEMPILSKRTSLGVFSECVDDWWMSFE